jgi:Domain of unknown function (DUF4303)
MTRLVFANMLRQAILAALIGFRERHPGETPYAFALIGGAVGDYLLYAVATEQGLLRTASKYDALGYRYQGHDKEKLENLEKLAVWLRWANPDDGWLFGDFPEEFEILPSLGRLLASGEIGEDPREFEEFCTEVLASLHGILGLKVGDDSLVKGQLTLGFTYGEDPRDFLRSATRANPNFLVQRILEESRQADVIAPMIKRVS